MARSVLARSRALTLFAAGALAVVIGGCAAPASSTVSVTGKTLSIYASLPSAAGGAQEAQDILSAERLALSQAGAQVGNFKVVLKPLAATTTAEITTGARKAIQDPSTIAYLGELVPHTSFASLGITNAQDVLQVSPSDTALELTKKTPAVSNSPTRYYESLKAYSRTFARVVPTTALEARALVQEMRALRVKKLYVADDGQPYGATIALSVRGAAQPSIAVVAGKPGAAAFKASGADALFLGASSQTMAASLFGDVAMSSPRAKLFGPSGLGSATFAAGFGPAKLNLYISAPGFLPKDLPAAGQQFVTQFQSTYGHAPAPEAIFGYAAMSAVLRAIHDAGASAGSRGQVVKDLFALKNVQSALGTYSIDPDGDIRFATAAPFVISRLQGGRLVPFKFVPVQG